MSAFDAKLGPLASLDVSSHRPNKFARLVLISLSPFPIESSFSILSERASAAGGSARFAIRKKEVISEKFSDYEIRSHPRSPSCKHVFKS